MYLGLPPLDVVEIIAQMESSRRAVIIAGRPYPLGGSVARAAHDYLQAGMRLTGCSGTLVQPHIYGESGW